ncbi:MAG: DUF6622 family protein [Devosia sp.]
MTTIAITIVQIIIHTPIWIWPLLLLLIWRGLSSARSRDVGLGQLVLLPLVLVSLSALSTLEAGVSSAVMAGIAIGAMGGVAAGLTLERRRPAQALGYGRLRLAGEWTTLVVVLVGFTMGYGRAVTRIMAPGLATSMPFLLATSAISAFFSVMLLTRTVLRLRVLLAVPALAA